MARAVWRFRRARLCQAGSAVVRACGEAAATKAEGGAARAGETNCRNRDLGPSGEEVARLAATTRARRRRHARARGSHPLAPTDVG